MFIYIVISIFILLCIYFVFNIMHNKGHMTDIEFIIYIFLFGIILYSIHDAKIESFSERDAFINKVHLTIDNVYYKIIKPISIDIMSYMDTFREIGYSKLSKYISNS